MIKITANKRAARMMADNMDVDVSELLAGKLTKAEILGHQEFSINRIGPSL